jgi:hypothetical protein
LYPKLILGLRIDWKLFLYWEISDWSCWNYHGDIQCKNADIEGKFEGTIERS